MTDDSPQSIFHTPHSALRTPHSVAALLTPRGRGAVATVRFIGDCRSIDASDPPLFRAANGNPLSEQPIDRIVFGEWGRDVSEDVVLCRTGEETLEIHCHGGEAAARAILSDLESAGCEIKTAWQLAEQTSGLFESECMEALTRATTRRTAEILLEQQSGVLRREIEAVRELASSTAENEAFDRLDALLGWSGFGLHLSCPWNVVLAGRPNVGKSSLINALVGFSRSIVYEEPGTTRDVVTVDTALEGWPIRFSDTAGIRQQADELETAGIQRARRTLGQADCRLLLLDVSRPLEADDRQLLADWPDAIRIAHKCDLPIQWETELPAGALPVSSVTAEGLDALAECLIARLVPDVPKPETPIPITERQIDLLSRARGELAAGNRAGCIEMLGECLA